MNEHNTRRKSTAHNNKNSQWQLTTVVSLPVPVPVPTFIVHWTRITIHFILFHLQWAQSSPRNQSERKRVRSLFSSDSQRAVLLIKTLATITMTNTKRSMIMMTYPPISAPWIWTHWRKSFPLLKLLANADNMNVNVRVYQMVIMVIVMVIHPQMLRCLRKQKKMLTQKKSCTSVYSTFQLWSVRTAHMQWIYSLITDLTGWKVSLVLLPLYYARRLFITYFVHVPHNLNVIFNYVQCSLRLDWTNWF